MKRAYCATICLILSLLAGCAAGPLSGDQRLEKGIVADGINVSSMTVDEARAILSEAAEIRLDGTSVTLRLGEQATIFPFSTLGASFDTEATVRKAAALRRKGGTRDIRSALVVDETELSAVLGAYVENNEAQPADASVTVAPALPTPVTLTEETVGVAIDGTALFRLVREALLRGNDCVIDTPHTREMPAVTAAALLETRSLVSQYTTSFEASPYDAENRVFNIQKAADAMNGILLQPGESFDCNAVLGDRTATNGWKEATAIRNGRYEDEYGGGVCQVSSTLFNAVMMADLDIIERHPHSWPMGYVDIGRDATISTGGKNFRFINSSEAPLQIFLYVDSAQKTVTASLYGKPLPAGQYIEIVSEKTGTIESAGETLMLDETLPYETRLVERAPRDGKTAVTYKAYHAPDGTLLRREVAYEDTYRAIDGLTYVSTDIYYS